MSMLRRYEVLCNADLPSAALARTTQDNEGLDS